MVSILTSAGLRRGWFPVALAGEVDVDPVQVWLLDEPWVLIRDRSTAGAPVVAFADRCPHRLAPLSAGSTKPDGSLQCGYHGWTFDGAGRCTLIPALGPDAVVPPRARLIAAAGVVERDGIVWLAPEPPLTDPPSVDLLVGDVEVGMLAPVVADVDPGLMLDNFLDVAHFPFVHLATFGTPDSDAVDEYVVERTPLGFMAVTEHEFAHHEDPGVAAGLRPMLQRRRMTYTYTPPFSAVLRLDYLDAGGTNIIVFAVQPQRGRTCRVYTVLVRNDLPAAAMPAAIEFEQRVLDEDLAVQVRMRSSLPTDLTAEVHTKADRLTIELRRALQRFVDAATTEA